MVSAVTLFRNLIERFCVMLRKEANSFSCEDRVCAEKELDTDRLNALKRAEMLAVWDRFDWYSSYVLP